MDRVLVTHLSSFWLALVMISLYVVPGLVGVRTLRRAVRWRRGLPDEVTGVTITVLAAVYGVMLAFAIVVLYQQYSEASDDVHAETGALVTLYRSSQQLAPPTAAAVKSEVSGYVDAVSGPEWSAMSRGKDSPQAWARIDGMYRVLGSYSPATAAERVFYDHAVTTLGTLVEARRVRLSDARSTLPDPFLVLLVVGGYVLMFFTLLFDIENPWFHDLVIVSLGTLIGFSIMLCLALEYPFSGSIAVSRGALPGGGSQRALT